jgi:hypothetical protein
MPRFWVSGPRILGGLVRPGISFSSRELTAWHARRGSPTGLIGIIRHHDGRLFLGIAGHNGENEEQLPDIIVPPVAIVLPDEAAALEVRSGAHVRPSTWAPMAGSATSRSAKYARPLRRRPARLG